MLHHAGVRDKTMYLEGEGGLVETNLSTGEQCSPFTSRHLLNAPVI